MRPLSWLLLLVLLVSTSGCDSMERSTTYFVQWVCGSMVDEMPSPDCNRVGFKLAHALQAIFPWPHYWEISRHQVVIRTGNIAELQLSPCCSVQIDRLAPSQRRVQVFARSALVACITQPAGNMMTIVGMGSIANTACFVIVRRDQPGSITRTRMVGKGCLATATSPPTSAI